MTDYKSLEELLTRSVPAPSGQYASDLRDLALRAYDRRHQTVHSRWGLSPRGRFFGWASAFALAVLAFFAFTATGRALAQQILQFGLFLFTSGATEAEKYMTTTPEIDSVPSVLQAGLAEASEITGFPVYYPTYLPAGYAPISLNPAHPVEVLFNSSGDVIKVEAMFERAEDSLILAFSQIPLDPAANVPPFNFGTGQVEPQLVNVGGNQGVWLENFTWGSRLDENGNPVPVPYNLLIWEMTSEEGTFQFWLGSEARLPLDVMLQIAESVGH